MSAFCDEIVKLASINASSGHRYGSGGQWNVYTQQMDGSQGPLASQYMVPQDVIDKNDMASQFLALRQAQEDNE